jgi:hypothetical protein
MTRQNSRSKADRVDPPCMDALLKLPEGRGFTGCGKTLKCCHPEPVRCHTERSEESHSARSG